MQNVSDNKTIENLVTQAENHDASVAKEAQQNIEKRAREASVRRLETAITNADTAIRAQVNVLREARKVEAAARAKLLALSKAREVIITTGKGVEFGRAYYSQNGYDAATLERNAVAYATTTLGLVS